MRLNLGEVARILGCEPGDVIWEGNELMLSGELRPGLATSGVALSLKDVARARVEKEAAGQAPGGYWCDFPWAGVQALGGQVDSRLIRPGQLFFCLPGEQADGHIYARAAAEAGAIGIVALRNPFAEGAESWAAPPVFLVRDVREALWRLAVCHRDTSLARVVGVTGTAGKTSVKEAMAQVLEGRGLTARNPKNFNNQIGLPVSMLNASADASFWVLEAGISEAHDMEELGGILRPDLALILNVGDGHISGLGERGVAAYKAMLLDFLQPGGTAVVSADYPDLDVEVRKRSDALACKNIRVVTFSAAGRKADFHARYEGETSGGKGLYHVTGDGTDIRLEAPFRGDFGSENVAAIVAAAVSLGLTTREIDNGLSLAALPDQRFTILESGSFTIVDDSYNANPLSAKRMVEAVARMARDRETPLLLVMGEMLELGDKVVTAHEALGKEMAQAGPVVIFWKGGHAAEVEKGLAEAGYAGLFYPVSGGQEFSLLLDELSYPRGLVLFKGSRGNKLERLVELFRTRPEAAGAIDAV